MSARFVSRYRNYTVGVQEEVAQHFGTGEKQVIKPFLEAQFQFKWVTDKDYAKALEFFKFPGQPEDYDTGAPIPPRSRVSVWDRDQAIEKFGYSEEEADLIVARLRATANATGHLELLPDPLKAPLPNYDLLSPTDIANAVNLLGIDPDLVLAYEEENENRPEVRAALNATRDEVVIEG